MFRPLIFPLLGLVSINLSFGATNPVVAHNARFTVVTPNLIRMEYAPSGEFVDLPSWFAVNRKTLDPNVVIHNSNDGVEIDTGVIQLTYKDDGKPFSPDNLHATIKKGDGTVTWNPSIPSTQNLGGTIRTLDQIKGPVSLGNGILSRNGWYLLDDSNSALFTQDWIQPRPKNGGVDWYLFGYGLDYKAAFQSLTAIGGTIPIPRKYTLGIWYSRYWPYSSDEFKTIVKEYQDHDFPLDMIVMDMDWHLKGEWTGYTWNKSLIADPVELIHWMHDNGLHVTLNDHPAEGIQPQEEMYSEYMKAMGKDPKTPILFDAGDKHYLDSFYQYSHEPREKEGVDFWWLDWQQYPQTRSIPEVTNLQVLNFYNYTRSQAGGLRGQSFSRWAGWGDQRYPIEFSGDADTGWNMLTFEVPFTSTAGNMGAFFWSHDIGGHTGGRNEESYARWCQFGAFTTALRSHSTRNATMDRRPWTYPDWAEASMHDSFHMRSVMMPYLYTSIWQANQTSVPFIRPLYIDYPEAEQSYHNGQEYQFGDNLLVAPIAQAGVGPNRVATQAVWFPQGDWYDYFTGERFTGPTEGIAIDPIKEFPLYVRGGVPLPMQTYTPRPGTAPLTDLVLRCYPGQDGKKGESEVYEDDGVTTGYQHGQFATTKLNYLRQGDEITITISPTEGTFKGQPSSRRCIVELPCTAKLTTCSIANAKTTYDEASLTNRIELPEMPISQGSTLVIQAQEIDPALVVKRSIAKHLSDLLGQPYEAWKSSGATLPPDMETAFNAAQGYSLIEQNLNPYLYGSEKALLYCHNHQNTAEAITVQTADSSPQQLNLRSGDSFPGLSSFIGSGLPDTTASITKVSTPDGTVLQHESRGFRALSDDLALKAKVETSSGKPQGAIDGHIGGYPNDRAQEWTSDGEKQGAWIKLSWGEPVQAQSIWLYDRPNPHDHILAGILEFDDGTKMDVGPLPNDANSPAKVAFSAKTIHWVKFTVTQVSPDTENVGLSEIAVLKEP